MPDSLKKIATPVKDELVIFDEKFKTSLRSDVKLLNLVTNYILKQKGKRVRPILVLQAAALCGGVNDRTYIGASLVELLHTATLVHDDVVDDAEKRRGLPALNAVWKNKISILFGDYLLSRGLSISVDNKEFDFLSIMSTTVKRMAEGELLQIYKSKKLDIDTETYFKIISDKTASLLSTCCEIGAVSSSSDPEKQKAMKEYGENLGIAFQIRDDILDYIGSFNLFGKEVGGDIKDRKITLPLIYTLENSDSKTRKEILKNLKKGSKNKKVKEIIEMVKSSGGIDYADKIAREYAQKARECLQLFDDSENKTALLELVDFVIDRKK
ncbi:MAG: polyprenyl synthetase family protein [Rhodothermaceae bacterium]